MSGPKRIQLRRAKGWRKPAGAVVVSRPSVFGNPFTGPAAVWLFRRWLAGDPVSAGERFTFLTGRRDQLLARLPELRGKDLCCWCPLPPPGQPDHCHAAVLLEISNA